MIRVEARASVSSIMGLEGSVRREALASPAFRWMLRGGLLDRAAQQLARAAMLASGEAVDRIQLSVDGAGPILHVHFSGDGPEGWSDVRIDSESITTMQASLFTARAYAAGTELGKSRALAMGGKRSEAPGTDFPRGDA